MNWIKHSILLMIILLSGFLGEVYSVGLVKVDSAFSYRYFKKEFNKGVIFLGINGRESLTDNRVSRSEERYDFNANYYLNFNKWNYREYRQESINFTIGLGPQYGTGNSSYTDSIGSVKFDDIFYGIKMAASFDYTSRFYYDRKSYALIELDGFGKLEKIKIHPKGQYVYNSSLIMPSEDEREYIDNRLRYGLNARAGWGGGKLKVVNHYMKADFLFNNYYKGRIFSKNDIESFASKITSVHGKRNRMSGHSVKNEINQVNEYLIGEELLTPPGSLEDIWIYGEFNPRYDGKRFEIGPFFKYYNREPDYIYGAFAKYESHKYQNFNWNRNFKTEISYNRYKIRDWFLWESNLFYEYYNNIKSKTSIGIKYVPSVVVNDFNEVEPIKHTLIPYLEYYKQLNEKFRVNFAFHYNITESNEFFIKGPEFSLAFYRSKY